MENIIKYKSNFIYKYLTFNKQDISESNKTMKTENKIDFQSTWLYTHHPAYVTSVCDGD